MDMLFRSHRGDPGLLNRGSKIDTATLSIRTERSKPSIVFLLTVPRRFLCCSFSLFVCRWFDLSFFVPHLPFVLCIGKVVFHDYRISLVSSLILVYASINRVQTRDPCF